MLAGLALAAHMTCSVMVQPGMTLSTIATQHHTTWQAVYVENRGVVGANPNLIYPGEELNVCPGTKASGPAPVKPPPAQVNSPFCHSSWLWPTGGPHLWETPVGCYANIYWAGYGDCFGWIRHLLPNIIDLPAHTVPRPGAAIHIPAFMEGASSAGHWAYIIAVSGRWALISEENMYWRGGGYNKVSYRYLLLEPGMLYYYR